METLSSLPLGLLRPLPCPFLPLLLPLSSGLLLPLPLPLAMSESEGVVSDIHREKWVSGWVRCSLWSRET